MLIIGREVGQSVIIGDQVKVTVLQVGLNLHLDITAPKEILVSRIKQSPATIKMLKQRSRRVGETVLIGNYARVTLLQTESGLIRFAIEAPKEICIYREELYQNQTSKIDNL